MATQIIPSPTGRSLPSSFHHLRKPDKPHFPTTLNSFTFLTTHPWMSSSSVQFTILNSSASPSLPTLQHEDRPPPPSEAAAAAPTSLSFLEPRYEENGFCSSTASSALYKQKQQNKTQIGNRDDFILDLLKSPNSAEMALEMYEEAKKSSGFRPRRSTMKGLMKYLVRSKKWDLVASLTEDVRRYGVFPDGVTYGKAIASCIKARKFKVVDGLLNAVLLVNETSCSCEAAVDRDDDNDVVSVSCSAFVAALRGYNKLHMYSSTISVYEQMMLSSSSSATTTSSRSVLENNSAADEGWYYLVMKAYLELGKTEKVVKLFNEVESKWKLDSSSIDLSKPYEVLIEALAGRRSASSSTAFRKCLDYLKEMEVRGIPASDVIYNCLICSFASIGEVELVEKLTKEGAEKQMLKDPALFMKLVSMYVKQKQIDKTLEVVKKMRDAKVKVTDCVFCTIVNGFAKQRGLKSAVEVYNDLTLRQGIEPGQVTLASILNVYCRLGMNLEAERAFALMESKGFDKCVVAYSSMIVMYGKNMKLKEAMKLVAKMKSRGCEPNVWIYNALIDLHGKAMNVRQVEKLWKEMKRRKVGADRVSYTSLIAAYSRVREYEKCVEFYQEFRLNGGELDRAMAGIMVGVLSKVGRVDELVKLLSDMRTQGTTMDSRLFMSALYALKDAGLDGQIGWLKDSFGDHNNLGGDAAAAAAVPSLGDNGAATPVNKLGYLEMK